MAVSANSHPCSLRASASASRVDTALGITPASSPRQRVVLAVAGDRATAAPPVAAGLEADPIPPPRSSLLLSDRVAGGGGGIMRVAGDRDGVCVVVVVGASAMAVGDGAGDSALDDDDEPVVEQDEVGFSAGIVGVVAAQWGAEGSPEVPFTVGVVVAPSRWGAMREGDREAGVAVKERVSVEPPMV